MSDGQVIAESARNISFVGHSDQLGRGHSDQVMVARGHAYVGHSKSHGITVTDVRDPRKPRPVNFLPIHAGSWGIHLQAHGDLLLGIEAFDFMSVMTPQEYYNRSIGGVYGARFGTRGKDFSAGMRVYDISDPATPRAIGFLEVEGLGIHRIWWVGDRYAYASALLDGFTDYILLIIDMANPTKPVEVGRWWLPGMWAAGGETHDFRGRVALHHAVVADDVAYGAWRNGGLTLIDVTDKTAPRLISHRNWSPPFAGGTHSPLPLPDRELVVVADEAVMDIDKEPAKPIWMVDVRARENPVTIATFPIPSDQDYVAKGGHFGPHNLHENRPGSFQSSTTIFATYQNAGLRVFDITNQFRPEETGWFVPPTPTRWMEPMRGRKKVLHSSDVFVAQDGLIYLTDYDAGLYILQWHGHTS